MATPEMGIDQLSESQQLALQQYTSVTDQEATAAISLLQRSQWNVEVRSPVSLRQATCAC
jgi:FAS-associated factor 2